ncbi:MAG: hypothetical protein K2R93_15605 [Gemmatimonadaceae bacterium]|nr:hypothetical protein [Gemmatimonadaceae bacterium]
MASLALLGGRPAAALVQASEPVAGLVAHTPAATIAEAIAPALVSADATHPSSARASRPAPAPRQLWHRASARRLGREFAAALPAPGASGSISAASALKCQASRCQGRLLPCQSLTDRRPSAPRAPPSQA